MVTLKLNKSKENINLVTKTAKIKKRVNIKEKEDS
jgi:hypothetical protein